MTRVCVLLIRASLQLHQMSQQDVDAFLAELHARQPDLAARVVEVAQHSLGAPYADGPLGEGPQGKYDQDPLMDLTRVDCVTFVEQTLALALCDNHADAFNTLQEIRYREGRIAFETRNHFLIADWVPNNSAYPDVTARLGVPTGAVSRTISRKDYFRKVNAPGLGQDTPDQPVELAYVATADAAKAAANLPSPALIVFIGNIDWLFALHCGLFIRDADANGKLYHASSKAGCVVATDFLAYLDQQSARYRGFTAYAITQEETALGRHSYNAGPRAPRGGAGNRRPTSLKEAS